MLSLPGYPDSEFVYLPRAMVLQALQDIDVLEVVGRALLDHASGRTVLPQEAYLGWQTSDGHAARSICLPGAVPAPGGGYDYGSKIINGSLGNVGRGIGRAQGLIMLHDPEIAWPRVVMEAAHLSALRTGAVTAVGSEVLRRPGAATLAILGCGTLARAHLLMLERLVPLPCQVWLFDRDERVAHRLAADFIAEVDEGRPDVKVFVAGSARECVERADVVVTATTVTGGYIPFSWLRPGALVSHVSLDDLRPEVVERADLVVVDDWDLVRADERRLLGRMHRQGRLVGPRDSRKELAAARVHTTLAEVVAGEHPGRSNDTDVVLLNPFGMGVLDVALAAEVARSAARAGIGMRVPR